MTMDDAKQLKMRLMKTGTSCTKTQQGQAGEHFSEALVHEWKHRMGVKA